MPLLLVVLLLLLLMLLLLTLLALTHFITAMTLLTLAYTAVHKPALCCCCSSCCRCYWLSLRTDAALNICHLLQQLLILLL
jgi:hypothetical protein